MILKKEIKVFYSCQLHMDSHLQILLTSSFVTAQVDTWERKTENKKECSLLFQENFSKTIIINKNSETCRPGEYLKFWVNNIVSIPGPI